MDIIAYAQTINPSLFTPVIIGWFVKMHYKTTKNAFKLMFNYAKLKEFFGEKKINRDLFGKRITRNSIYKTVLSSFYYYMYPDLKMKSHGWDMTKDKGDILDMIGEVYDNLIKKIRAILKAGNSYKGDVNDIAISVGALSHLIADSYTIGQISSEFWGKVDDRIDFWSEWCRAEMPPRPQLQTFSIMTKEELLQAIHKGIIDTYMLWHKQTKKWERCIYRRWCWLGPWKVRRYAHLQTAKASVMIATAFYNAYREAMTINPINEEKGKTKEIANVRAKKKAK